MRSDLRLAICGATVFLAASTLARAGDAAPAFAVESLILYQHPDLIDKRHADKVKEIADYLKKLEEAAGAYWKELPRRPGQTALLIVFVKPGRQASFWCTDRTGDLKPEAAEGLRARLGKVEAPQLKAPLLAALKANLWGGLAAEQKRKDRPVPEDLFFPKEWREAAERKKVRLQIPLPDEALAVIWPETDPRNSRAEPAAAPDRGRESV
jgi:hypothetical protein